MSLLASLHPAAIGVIVSMPRSGTALIEQIVASHSKVCGAAGALALGAAAGGDDRRGGWV
jgi:hypothetical protein